MEFEAVRHASASEDREPARDEPRRRRSTGSLPPSIQAAFESVSGVGLSDVEVHYDSPRPAELGALAYAEGSTIHLGRGQERHLAHETWHVVQQKQGRVRPMSRTRDRDVNTDTRLEAEADRMGERGTRLARSLMSATTAQRESADQPRMRRASHAATEAPTPAGIRPDGDVPSEAARSTRIRRSASAEPVRQPVVQGRWRNSGATDDDAMEREVPSDVIAAASTFIRDAIGDDDDGLLAAAAALLDGLRRTFVPFTFDLVVFLTEAFKDEDVWTARAIADRVLRFTDPNTLDGGDEAGHDDDVDATEIDITFDNLGDVDLYALTTNGELDLLRTIFDDLVYDTYDRLPTVEDFDDWFFAGVVTRSWFDRRFGNKRRRLNKRTPGAVSTQARYTGSNGFGYRGVSYQLDNVHGNIDFMRRPLSHVKWKDPVSHKTKYNLELGSKKKHFGIMPSGKFVDLRKASRSQHFAVANRVSKRRGPGSPANLTWHHLSERYKMVLVDRTVHAKHGHNGGMLVW